MNRRELFKAGLFAGGLASGLPLRAAAAASDTDVCLEPARKTPVAGNVDVLVCGAGPAGVAAALSAARSGAETRLLEVHGCLGGVWTAGLLSNIIDADNKTTGIMPEILRELSKCGAQIDALRYDSEAMKLVLEEMCQKAGVKVLLHTRVVATIKDGSRITTAITENRSGRQAWRAKVFIDTTGDGDLAALAGCKFDFGHPETGRTQPMSLMALLVGISYKELHARGLMRGNGVSSFGEGITSNESKINIVKELRRAGIDPSYTGPALFPVRDDLVALMVNHEYHKSSIDAQQVTDATLHARAEVNHVVASLRALGGVWKNARLVATGEQIGTREGRRIHGRYTVTKDDIQRGARFEDAVCRVTAPVDIHSTEPSTTKRTTSEGMKVKPYDISLRSLIAADVDGLMMAGRCISGDFFAHASYRVTGNAVPMGEAAGRVAAQAARKGRLPHEVSG
jgi:hypothetical protein